MQRREEAAIRHLAMDALAQTRLSDLAGILRPAAGTIRLSGAADLPRFGVVARRDRLSVILLEQDAEAALRADPLTREIYFGSTGRAAGS